MSKNLQLGVDVSFPSVNEVSGLIIKADTYTLRNYVAFSTYSCSIWSNRSSCYFVSNKCLFKYVRNRLQEK